MAGAFENTLRLTASRIHAEGLHLTQSLRPHVHDPHFTQNEIRNRRGAKDRFTTPPVPVKAPLQENTSEVQAVHESNPAAGGGDHRFELPTICTPAELMGESNDDQGPNRERGSGSTSANT